MNGIRKLLRLIWGRERSSSVESEQSTLISQSFNKISIVILGNTHGNHNCLQVPDGEMLIHTGNFTLNGSIDDAVEFNSWLGRLPHPIKIVVNGSHESRAFWKDDIKNILYNAKVL